MDKSQVFIASSGRALTLAERLGDFLNGSTTTCAATLWTRASRGQPSSTIIEMLEKASANYDFAVIVLARDDVLITQQGEALKARDNCVFEAGLFMGALGRKRCFLVNSVEQSALPSDLGGIIYKWFEEPEDLTDPDQCAKALNDVVRTIAEDIESARTQGGCAKNKYRVNLLPSKDLLEREHLDRAEGGELEEGQVVVTAIQPVETDYGPALRVRKNIDKGVNYLYYFHGNANGANNICRLLQMVLIAPYFDSANRANDFTQRLKMLGRNAQQVLEDLRRICANQTMRIVAIPDPPTLEYCIHNATNPEIAVAYLKYTNRFLEWAKGSLAYDFWNEVREKYAVKPKPTLAMFYEAEKFKGKAQQEYYRSIEQGIAKYFPGMDQDVLDLCVKGVPKKR